MINAHPVALLTLASLLACSEQAPPESPNTKASATHDCCAEQDAGAPLPDTSVYQLNSKWQDQTGTTRSLASFRGQPVVLAMIFTTCEYACPRTLADLKAIEAGLGSHRKNTHFLLVSFDAEKDLPPALAAYAKSERLDLDRWTLLHGAEPDIRELAAVLGVKYKRSKSIGFSHSNSIYLLSADGRVLHQQNGIGTDPKALLDALRN